MSLETLHPERSPGPHVRYSSGRLDEVIPASGILTAGVRGRTAGAGDIAGETQQLNHGFHHLPAKVSVNSSTGT